MTGSVTFKKNCIQFPEIPGIPRGSPFQYRGTKNCSPKTPRNTGAQKTVPQSRPEIPGRKKTTPQSCPEIRGANGISLKVSGPGNLSPKINPKILGRGICPRGSVSKFRDDISGFPGRNFRGKDFRGEPRGRPHSRDFIP